MFLIHKQRIMGDMIKVFKILNNLNKINPEIILEMNNATITRSYSMKFKVQGCNTIACQSYFNVRNRLPASVVSSKILHSFKSQLDIYLRETVFINLSIHCMV